ncbi:L,D-transpeptidase family protein [Streptomyces nitrosporeus]|uniref:L,D-transpeptidase family protein n=1 Tax=Streptomyces nitrosporeus TaxID=28894 RepID=UPI00399FE774
MSVPRRPYVLSAALFLLAAGCSAAAGGTSVPRGADGPPRPAVVSPAVSPSVSPAPAPPKEIPALGPRTRALIPAEARQAVVVTGEGPDSDRSTVAFYTREDPAAGWTFAAGPWRAHNGRKGWTGHHVAGDLRSPVGVFGLTDAGGRLEDPGSLLPYDEQPDFATSGEGFFGEPLEGSFDYVVAINYNRVPGRSPLDRERPLGDGRGGGIWIHVDHGGPTQGCVSVPEERMEELLRTLDPEKSPVIVMGDPVSLNR